MCYLKETVSVDMKPQNVNAMLCKSLTILKAEMKSRVQRQKQNKTKLDFKFEDILE